MTRTSTRLALLATCAALVAFPHLVTASPQAAREKPALSQQQAGPGFEQEAIQRVQRLPASQLEPSLPPQPFAAWLKEALGPQAGIEWEVNDCGEQTGDPEADKGRDFPACVAAHATLPDDREVEVLVAVGTRQLGFVGQPALRAVSLYESGNWSDLDRLAELPDELDAGGGWKQFSTQSSVGPREAVEEIRNFFDRYLRLHAEKNMDAWLELFLPEAVCVRTADDGRVITYRAADLATSIAEEAKKLDSQHETFDDIRIEVSGDAAMYSAHWKLFHNGAQVREGRAWFLLARKDKQWRISALTWYRASGSGVR